MNILAPAGRTLLKDRPGSIPAVSDLEEKSAAERARSDRREIAILCKPMDMRCQKCLPRQKRQDFGGDRFGGFGVAVVDLHSTATGISVRKVQRATESMPHQCRDIFLLRRVQLQSIGEIAHETGLSASTVEDHLVKAVLLLGRAMAEFDGQSDGEAEAARYFVALLDDPSPQICAERDAWLSADPRNGIAWNGIAQAWQSAAALRLIAPSSVHDERTAARGQAQQQQQ